MSSDRSSPSGFAFPVLLILLLAAGGAALAYGRFEVLEFRSLAFVLASCAVTFVAAGLLARELLAGATGGEGMRTVYEAIKEGAEAFMRRQYRTIAIIAALTSALVYLLYAFIRTPSPDDPVSVGALAIGTAAAFIFGAFCSGVAGVLGMWVAIRTNVRVAVSARTSTAAALRTALRGGAVAGLVVPAMSLAGVATLFALLRANDVTADHVPLLVIGYGFGASFVALFAQLGGGIYTKAADVAQWPSPGTCP